MSAAVKGTLLALNIIGINNFDCPKDRSCIKEEVIDHYKQLKRFVKVCAENALSSGIASRISIELSSGYGGVHPTPEHKMDKPAQMIIARSFDINKPGTPIDKNKGCVIGWNPTEGVR